MKELSPTELNNLIHLIRGKPVMLDSDIAALYYVETKNLNKAVRRNLFRFPEDFMFQLTKTEYDSLRFQTGTLKRGKHSKYLPYAFTEHGILMLSSVLKSERAIEVNIQIMRAFVKIRRFSLTTIELKRRLDGMEKNYDTQFRVVFDALRQLIESPNPSIKKPGMGFTGEK